MANACLIHSVLCSCFTIPPSLSFIASVSSVLASLVIHTILTAYHSPLVSVDLYYHVTSRKSLIEEICGEYARPAFHHRHSMHEFVTT